MSIMYYNEYLISAGIDGCHIKFDGAPRQLPPGLNKDQFINRKGCYSLNVLVTGSYDHRILDLVLNAPGSYHDAGIWRVSQAKPYLELLFPRVHVLGDSAFPLTDTMIIPFSKEETIADADKALFNIRHSAARVEMTENIYGIWKQRFPILRQMRIGLENTMKVIECTAILHNIGIAWGDMMPRDMFPNDPPGRPPPVIDDVVVHNLVRPDVRRQQGVHARRGLQLMCLQSPPTGAEVRRVRRLQAQLADT